MNKTYSKLDILEKINILGIWFSNAYLSEVLEYTVNKLINGTKNYYFVTPNPELLVLSSKVKRYKNVLNSADLALADGVGIMWASKILGKSIKGRITGVDLVEKLCKYIANRPITVGFLGGGPRVAEDVSECLVKKYPGLKVAFHFGGKPDIETLEFIKKEIGEKNSNNKIDILFVAFGSPKQELWINENLQNLPAKITIGVGGAFDFISGRVKRAPLWMRRMGLEWLFRLIIQPWRIKRQASLIRFIYIVIKEKIFPVPSDVV